MLTKMDKPNFREWEDEVMKVGWDDYTIIKLKSGVVEWVHLNREGMKMTKENQRKGRELNLLKLNTWTDCKADWKEM